MEVQGKRALVVGLARTGLAAAHVLARQGAAVTVSDARPPWELRADIADLLANKIGMELGLHREETFLSQDLIVVSPGVLPEMPQLDAARRQNIPVVSEIEAASWFLKGPMIGITGSNGKTTTTALLGEILEASAFPTFVGGNIGVPLISAVGELPEGGVVVTELSSFQLEATVTFRPHVAVLLNITPNHLDRHPSLEAYIQAKARIFANQTPDDYAILNADDPTVMALAPWIRARKILFSRQGELPEGLFVEDGHIVYRTGNLERVLLTTKEIPLRGEFNVENVLAAAAAACVVGADFEAIRRAVAGFRGVEHRLEFVQKINGVQFFNDSKATSVDASAKALSAFDGGVHLILGGKDKGAPYGPIRDLLDGRARAVYLIGAAAKRIANGLAGTVALHHSGDLETAVHDAYARAVPGDVVLLSPACASFDQFQDYEHRGHAFKEIVRKLSVEKPPQVSLAAARLGPEVAKVSASISEAGAQNSEETISKLEEQLETSKSNGGALEDRSAHAEIAASDRDIAHRVPERVYVYEISAEETEYPEAEFLVTQPEVATSPLDFSLVAVPDPLVDQALPFEIRAKATLEAMAGPMKKSGGDSKV